MKSAERWVKRDDNWYSRGRQESLIQTAGGYWLYYATSIADGVLAGRGLKAALKFVRRRDAAARRRQERVE